MQDCVCAGTNFAHRKLKIMAAIIAQMTRANRERRKKKRYEISKCMYELPPFAARFEPQV